MIISKWKILFYLNLFIQLTLTLTLNSSNNNNNSNNNESTNNINDYENISELNNNDDDNNGLVQQSDQINLLSKQMNALMIRRRDDMKLLENNLKKYIKKNFLQYPDMNIQNEINELRDELKSLRATKLTSNKERLTIEWLKESINELRGELIVLQEQSNNITREIQKNNQYLNNLNELKTNIDKIKLDYDKINKNYNNLDKNLNELRDETEFNRNNNNNNHIYVQNDEQQQHKKRHLRYIRHQIINLEKSSENLKNQLAEIKTNNYDDRIHEVEMKQNHLMNVNFNLTREIVNFDKLHSSMLELLEDVEAVQTKVDNTIPEIQKEISKLEFNTAQLASDHNKIREETQNMNKKLDQAVQATNTVQDNKNLLLAQQEQISQLRYDIDKIKSIANINRENLQKRIEKIEKDSKQNSTSSSSVSILLTDSNDIKSATDIVKDLENIEQQYESIINKLPNDCSQINFDLNQNNQGLYLIAPLGQHNPILTQCDNKWTTIQKRYDGSVDFNQSWEQYANGFGNPSGEFWIGNNVLHQLTQKNCTKLKIRMQDIYDNQWMAEYDEFYVGAREEGYRLVVSKYSGNASDALDYQNRMEFSAIDMDRDISNTHCAANYEGGWWFSHCQHANLNGRYNLGLTWFDSTRNEWIAVKSSHMMISQRNNCKPK